MATCVNLCGQNKVIDSLQQIVTLNRQDTVHLEALLQLSNEFMRRDLSVAKKYASTVIVLADSPAEAKWLSGGYNYLITIYQQTGKPDSSLYFLKQSQELVKKNAGKVKMLYNFNQAAGLFYKNRGELKQALPYMLDNLNIWTKQDENRAGLMLNLGNLYFNLGDFKKAADYHLQSLRLFETLKNLRGQSFCLQSLGNDLFNLNQLASAKEYYERSLHLKKQLDDARGILNSTISLGDVYKDLNNFEKSESYYQAAMTSARTMKLPGEEARVLHQSGLLYRRMNENKKARESFTKSIGLSRQTGDSVTLVKTKSELFALDLAEQNQEKMESQLLKGLNTIIRTGDRQQEAVEYHRLSEYYAQHKDFEKSLYYLQKHEALTDSVEGREVLIQLKDLEEKYKSEKKEKEIELLKKDQDLQALELQKQRANTTIIIIVLISFLIIGTLLINRYRVMNRIKRQAELERMRQNIARDLHDDIGSTLSSINIMSKLAMQQTDNNSHLQKISTYSSRMMETMSDMVWSINPINDSVEQMMAKMREFAAEMLEPKNIQYTFSHEENLGSIRLDVEKRKSFFLIFKEAINNIAKYSEATQVNIRLLYGNNLLSLQVEDNGKGFNPDTVTKGNGLKNMAARALAIKSNWKHASEPGKGTSVLLEVPIT